MRIIDLTGRRFGKLVVKGRNGSIDNKPTWACVCDCVNTITVRGKSLREGSTKSCGCYSKECSAHTGRTVNRKHGQYGTRIYRIWSGMHARCSNPNLPEYLRYGGRGITVCEEWSDFASFYLWACENGYDDSLTIDRIDNDKGYAPENCRWATMKEQSNNKRNNIRVTYQGESHTLKEWAELLGVNYESFKWHYHQHGVESAFLHFAEMGVR